MKRYDSYKNSGVEWIGEIPSHWDLRKGSTIGKYSKGNGIKKDEVKESGLPCIRYGEIYTRYNHKVDSVQTFVESGVTDVVVVSGTLLMTGSGELLEDIGKCVVYLGEEDLLVGGDIIILKPNEEFDSEFLSYQINSECVRIQRELNGRGGIIVHIYSKNFKDMRFPSPTFSEQQQIVSFLDSKTSQIDELIQKKERKIELLKEYRTSLINQVVTKGLNPNVEMKDSGVEWIGEIPSHWVSSPLKRLVKIGNGRDYKHIEVENGGYPVYGTGGIFSRCSEYLHTGPSVLLGRKGTIDNPLFVNEPFWTSDTIYFTIIDESKILPSLLFRLVHQIPFDLFRYGSTIPSMTKSDYEEMKFPVPPLYEQEQIVEYLNDQTSKIDNSIQLEEKKIELLKEYRQSLISSVVTGKIDVRTN